MYEVCEVGSKRKIRFKMIWPEVNQRLSRLYDAKFDGDSIDEEVFKIKENEYKATIAEFKAQIRTLDDRDPDFYQDACRILELFERLFPLFLKSSYEEKPISSNS